MQLRAALPIILVALVTTVAVAAGFVVPAPAGPLPPAASVKHYDPLPR